MKTYRLLLVGLLSLVGFAACTSDEMKEVAEAVSPGSGYIKHITATVANYGTTRSELYRVDDDINFRWGLGDTLGVFPDNGSQVYFAIKASQIGGLDAAFDGGAWGLKASHKYSAYYPYEFLNRDIKRIPFSYEGQVQRSNASLAHLGAYDFLASNEVSPENGSLNFVMSHLGSILMLNLTVEEAGTFVSCVLSAEEEIFTKEAYLDISNTTPYFGSTKKSKEITLRLQDVSTTDSQNNLMLSMMVYPIDLTGKTIQVKLINVDGSVFSGTIANPKKLEAGKPYEMNAVVSYEAVSITNANLITATEASSGQTFTKNADGTVSLAFPENLAIVESVTELDLNNLNDPTVCDQIELFTSLKILKCDGNQLTRLDVSQLKKLEQLFCSYNELTELNLMYNTKLLTLFCNYNKLSNLNVSTLEDLLSLLCTGNNLSSIDLTNNNKLGMLHVSENNLTTIDLSQNPKISFLDVAVNKLSSLDLTNNPEITYLVCNYNQLTNLKFENNTKIKDHLYCGNNKLTELDISMTAVPLERIWVGNQTNGNGDYVNLKLYVNNEQKAQTLAADYSQGYFSNNHVEVFLKSGDGNINLEPTVPNPRNVN